MKIMSFNTQHCLNFKKRRIDFEIMAETIKNCQADVVGLNEMRDKGIRLGYTAQTKKLSLLTGLENYYFAKAIDVGGKRNPYGNGILSRIPIVNAETIIIPDPEIKTGKESYETRCLLKTELENGYTVLVTHFGLNEDEQKNAVETVLANLKDEKCILMGDFNITPENEILKPIRERMKDTAVCFSSPLLSFPSDKPEIKIDYIFVSSDVEILNADIPSVVASDHRPHIAEVN